MGTGNLTEWRVGIEATSLLLPKQTGIQRYTSALVSGLVELLEEQSDIKLFLYFHAAHQEADSDLLKSYPWSSSRVRCRAYHLHQGWSRVVLPAMALVDRLDLFHFLSPMMPPWCPCPAVVTFHDVVWKRLAPEDVRVELEVVEPYAERAVKQAIGFIAVSENTRQDLIECYGISPARVWVTLEGVDSRYQPRPDQAKEVRRKYGLSRYILYVGILQRRKNLIRLMESFAQVKRRLAIDHALVLAGPEGWRHEEVYSAAAQRHPDVGIRILGYVPEEDLPGLYTGADLFVYPSLYEGFGLPVLEAMACGTPVAVSRTSSLPEVVGDAGLYFDPSDTDQIATCISQALSNQPLRERLRRKGLEQAAKFSWQKMAQETLEVYQRVARSSTRGNSR